MSDFISNAALITLSSLPLLVLFACLYEICNPTTLNPLCPEIIKDCDIQCCEQMRGAGQSETEIEEFMDNCGGYYEPPTQGSKAIL